MNKRRNLIITIVVICVIGIIIAFGIIVEMSKKSIDLHEEGDFSKMGVYNKVFTNYIGKQKGTTIEALLKTVVSSNATNINQVEVDATDIGITSKKPEDIRKEIQSTSYYNVNVGYAEDGFVNKIFITKTNSNTQNTTFTKTYKVLNVADSNDENYLYLTIRQFQEEEIETVKVQRSLANIVQEENSYEFTFQYTDNVVEENIESIFTNTMLIEIKKTDKQGLDQIQDSIERYEEIKKANIEAKESQTDENLEEKKKYQEELNQVEQELKELVSGEY